jgi:hypothetical protein
MWWVINGSANTACGYINGQWNGFRASPKKLGVHMDGWLASLKQVIGEAEFDIVEAIIPQKYQFPSEFGKT